MRKVLTAFVFAIITNVLNCTESEWGCPIDLTIHSPTLRIRRQVFCDYDPTVRPSQHHDNKTQVTLRLMPKFIEFDDRTNTLTVHSWLFMFWRDAFLTWDKSQYDNVDNIHVTSNEVWQPDFSVYNSGDMGSQQIGMPSTNCVLSSSGMVSCAAAVKYVTRCAANYTDWPFDRHNCTVRLGSWTHTGEEIDFTIFAAGSGMMRDYSPNAQWDLLSINVTKHVYQLKNIDSDTFPYIHYHFLIERHSPALRAVIIAPAVVLVFLGLVSLWLDPSTTERVVLASVNFVSHLLCITTLFWEIPFNGASTPRILIFHADSLIISGVILILTVLLRHLRQLSVPAPAFLSSIISDFLANRLGQMVLLSTLDPRASTTLESQDDNAGLVQSNSTAKPSSEKLNTWFYFSVFVDRLALVAISLTYMILASHLFPVDDTASEPDLSAM